MSTKPILLGVALCLALPLVASAAPCKEPMLEKFPSTDAKCRFYKGTRHFRSEDYAAAAREWQALIDASDMPKEHEYLRVDAQNNLGYLYHMGWGVKQDRERAITLYWLPAGKFGHREAGYHLCHAYAESKPKVALGYCREALRRYNKAGTADGDDRTIVNQLRDYIKRIEAN